MPQHHTIGKLLLELQLPARENALPLQEKLGAVCKNRLVIALQELLDSWAGNDTLLRIDRLEIDLGACKAQDLERDLPEMVLSFLLDQYPSLQQQHAPLGTGMERQPVTQGYFDGWLYFLERGLLPDTTYVHDTAAWEAGVLEILATASTAMEKCRQVLVTQPAAISRMVLQFSRQFIHHWIQAYAGPAQQPIMQIAHVWEQYCYEPGFTPPSLPDRTVFQRKLDEWSIRCILSPAQIPEPAVLLEEVMTLTFGNNRLPQYVTALQQQAQLPGADGTLLSAALASLHSKYAAAGIASHTANAAEAATAPAREITTGNPVATTSGDNTAPLPSEHKDLPPVTAGTTESAPTATDQRKDKLPAGTGKAGNMPSISSQSEEQLQESAHTVRREEAFQPEHAAPAHKTSADTQQEQPVTENPLHTENRTEQRKTPGTPPEGFTTYINNAGLVLLHPYLHILFDAVGLLEKRAFKNPVAQDKAVQLLAFLACGETGVPEYELVLPKLLCGLLPEDPVDRFVELTEQDKTEANELLAAVIGNWKALGSASPDGLRGNFLMREGKLQWQWDEWRLRVTQQSYDLLLNRLPWGISVVRLPWMPWVLKTEWV